MRLLRRGWERDQTSAKACIRDVFHSRQRLVTPSWKASEPKPCLQGSFLTCPTSSTSRLRLRYPQGVTAERSREQPLDASAKEACFTFALALSVPAHGPEAGPFLCWRGFDQRKRSRPRTLPRSSKPKKSDWQP